MTRSLGLFSADADGRGFNISFLLRTWTDSGSLVKIGLLVHVFKRTKKLIENILNKLIYATATDI